MAAYYTSTNPNRQPSLVMVLVPDEGSQEITIFVYPVNLQIKTVDNR